MANLDGGTENSDVKDGKGELSMNWKALQKVLENDGPSSTPKESADGFFTITKRKRKIRDKKRPKLTEEDGGVWKKRREVFLEATSSGTDSEKKEVEATKVVGLDCEYVGVGIDGTDNMLARVSIVNSNGDCLYDKYVKPTEKIKDFRTEVSGIKPAHIMNGEPFQKVQLEVSKLLAGRVVVGHAVFNDFKVLNISHPRKLTRDTFKYPPLRKAVGKRFPSLKLLAEKILGIKIQEGQHDSVVDARAALKLYMQYRKAWEKDIQRMQRS